MNHDTEHDRNMRRLAMHRGNVEVHPINETDPNVWITAKLIAWRPSGNRGRARVEFYRGTQATIPVEHVRPITTPPTP